MSMLDLLNPFEDAAGLDPAAGAMMNQALRLYQREKLGEKAAGYFMPDEGQRLQREDQRLDIAVKRRALGLPQDSDDLEEAENERLPFAVKAAGYGLQKIPEPGFLRPKISPDTFPFRPFVKGIQDVAGRVPGFLRSVAFR